MKLKQGKYLLIIILGIGFSCQKVVPTSTTPVTTKYPLTLSPNNLLVSINVPPSTFTFANAGFYGIFESVDSVKIFSDIIYQRFKDDFDFIFFITNNATRPSNQPYGVNFEVSNSVKGIGGAIFKNGWGSTSDKLKSFMFLPYKDAIRYGPTLHEICHNWQIKYQKAFLKPLMTIRQVYRKLMR